MDLPIIPILADELLPYIGQSMTADAVTAIVSRVAMRCYPGPVNTVNVPTTRVGSYTLYPSVLASALDELTPLHMKHWAETEQYRHELAPKPDYQRGLDLEMQGRYLVLLARYDDGTLVGNYGIYLARSMHTQDLIATEDTLFIDAAHRKGRLGVRFIQYAETVLAALGVTEFTVSTKTVNGIGPMIERMGYPLVATQHTKILTPKETTHVLA